MKNKQLDVGGVGLDYAGLRPAPKDVRKNGAGFIVRYSAGAGNNDSATQFKLCGRNEIHDAVAAGLDFVANSEWYETRITEGAAAGAADGAADLTFWKARGLAKGASIYVSWDSDPSPSLWPQVDAYLEAYNKALQGYYEVDCYAGTPYLKHAKAKALIKYGWRPNAGSWSNDGLPYQPKTRTKRQRAKLVKLAQEATVAALWQTGNYWYSRGADEDMVIRPDFGSHLQAGGRHRRPQPGPKPTPWRYVLTLDSEGNLLVDGKAA